MTPKTQQGEAAWEAYLEQEKWVPNLKGLLARPAFLAGYQAALSAPSPSPAVREALAELVALIDNDAYAITFQTMGQYRSALLKAAARYVEQVREVRRDAGVNMGLIQGGLTNDELRRAWAEKVPGVVASDRDLTAFALGVEVGAALPSAPVQEGREPDAALREPVEMSDEETNRIIAKHFPEPYYATRAQDLVRAIIAAAGGRK